MRRRPALGAFRLVVGGLMVGGLVACGGSGDADTGGCGADEQERIDPDYLQHVITDDQEPVYSTDPPTSGAHAPGVARSGVVQEPLSRPEQVGQLEAGVVLLQHGALPAAQLADLEALAGDLVVVVPNPDLPGPVVATAWTRKLVCQTVDAEAIEALAAFSDAHAGRGPGSDG